MAALLLLGKVDKSIRGQDISRTVLHLTHGLQAVEDALSGFLHAVRAEVHGVEGDGDVLGLFDAHAGDCACHMRAQMLWELCEHYRTPDKQVWITSVLDLLAVAKAGAMQLLSEIRKKNGYMRALGFGSQVPLGEIYDRIGFTDCLALLEKADSPILSACDTPSLGGSNIHTEESSDLSTPAELNLSSTLTEGELAEKAGALREALVDVSESIERQRAPSSRGHGYRVTETDEWHLERGLTIVRFLTFAHVLALHKKATLEAGSPSCIRYRLDPEYSYAKNEERIAQLITPNGAQFSTLIVPAERAKKSLLTKENETIQAYVSSLSANWTLKLACATELSSSMLRLCRDAVDVSSRQITCVPSWVSIVPIRAEWLLRGTPILLLIRRFCSLGYHNVFYRVAPSDQFEKSMQPGSARDLRLMELGPREWFNISRVDRAEALSGSWARRPHFIFISNSIEGSMGDFYNRLVDDNYDRLGSNAPHCDDSCAEVTSHVERVLESNFSRIVMHFFGLHEQYPFTLPNGADDYGTVADHIAQTVGPDAVRVYREAIEGAVDHGTGTATSLYSFQHAFLELPVIIARQVESMEREHAKPAPFGYTWT